MDETYHFMSKLHADLSEQGPKASCEKEIFNLKIRLSAGGKL